MAAAEVANVANAGRAVDFVRLGALGVKADAAGTMDFDAFESRHQTAIGP